MKLTAVLAMLTARDCFTSIREPLWAYEFKR